MLPSHVVISGAGLGLAPTGLGLAPTGLGLAPTGRRLPEGSGGQGTRIPTKEAVDLEDDDDEEEEAEVAFAVLVEQGKEVAAEASRASSSI